MDALTFLDRPAHAKPQSLYVLPGDEPFLERRVLLALRRLVLGADDDGFGVSTHQGDKATWAAVLDDLQTLPMLAPRKLVVVEQADPFVSRERARLEKLVAELLKRDAVRGVLVLAVSSWAGTTKLAKMTPDANVIACNTPEAHALAQWCVNWSAAAHHKQLAAQAARLLVDLVGNEMGLLDQELQKLAAYVGAAPRIDSRDVDQLVGRSRTESTWKLFELIGDGKIGRAHV